MPYSVKYIKNFSDTEKIKQVCGKDISLGYKVVVFSEEENRCSIEMQDVSFVFCMFPMEQAVLHAKKYYAQSAGFYMDRAGIYTVDPKIYPQAIKIKEMDYEEAVELSVNGYNAIPPHIINLAKRNSIHIEVLSLDDLEPTVIKEVVDTQGNIIKSISKDPNIIVVTLTEIPDKKGATYNIFKRLSDYKIYVDSIMLPAANHNQQDISFCIKVEDKYRTKTLLEECRKKLEFKDIIINENVAKISVTGAGFQTQTGIAAKLLEVLYESDINVNMIFTSEVKISLVLELSMADKAIYQIHKRLIENRIINKK